MKEPIITVERFISDSQKQWEPAATGTLTRLLEDLILAGKIISCEVTKAGLIQILGETGQVNFQGDKVRKLDVFANDVFIHCLGHGRHICALISEEVKEIYPITPRSTEAKYVLALDPLDGSSNIDVNVTIGSIFSVFRKKSLGDTAEMSDFLQPGYEQVAAGYIIYGSSTMFVFSVGHGTHGFTLDPSVGEFLLSHPNIRVPQKGQYYSVNEANTHSWSPSVLSYINYLKSSKGGYSGRYIGSLVADFHRNMLCGGVFCYPAATSGKLTSGKLRLLYEVNPLAFVLEQAGGFAIDGKDCVLRRTPQGLHERVPLFMGSREEMQICLSYLNGGV